MAYDGTLKFDTSIDGKGFQSGLSQLGGLAAKAVAGVAAGLTGLSGAAIKIGSDFEEAMSRVKAISGATDEEFEKLNEQAKQLGADTSFSASQAAEGMENLAAAGFTVNEITDAMPGLLDLAAASGEGLASSSEIAASALRAFGLEASEAGHVADVLAANANMTNASVTDTGYAFKYVAPIAKSLGVSMEETAAAVGLLSNAGIKGEQAGTVLRGAMTRLVKPTDEAAAAMENLGVTFFDAEGQMKPLSTIIGDLSNATSGLSDEQKNAALSAIFGTEALSGMLALIDAGPAELERLTKAYQESDGAAAAAAATMRDNLKGALEELGGSFETLGIEIYESWQAPLKEAAQQATDYVNQMTDAFKEGGLQGLVEEMGTILSEVATKAAEAAPAMIDAAVDMIDAFVDGIGKNKDKLFKAAGEIAESLAEGLVKLLPKKLQKPVEDAVKAISKSLTGGGLKKALKTVENLFEGFMDIVSRLAKSVLPLATGALDALGENFDKVATLVGTVTGAMIAYNAAMKAAAIIQTVTSFLKKLHAAYILVSQGTAVATALQTAFATSAAAAYAPIYALVAVIGAVAGGFAAYNLAVGNTAEPTSEFIENSNELIEKANETSEALHNLGETREESMVDIEGEIAGIRDLADQVFELGDKSNKTAGEKKLLLDMIERLNDKMPDLELSYDETKDSISKTKDEVYKFIDSLEEQMKTQALMDLTQDAIKERTKAEMELKDVQEQRVKNQAEIERLDDQIRDAEMALGDAYAISAAEGYKAEDQITQLKNERKNLVATNTGLATSEGILIGSIQDANKEIQYCKDSVKELADSNNSAASSTESASERIQGASSSAALAYTGTGDAAEDMSNRVAGSYRTIQGKSGELVVFTKGKTDEMNTSFDGVGGSAENMANRVGTSTENIKTDYGETAESAENYASRTNAALAGITTDVANQTANIVSQVANAGSGVDAVSQIVSAAFGGMGTAAQTANTEVGSATSSMSSQSGTDFGNIAQNCRDMVNSMIIAIIPGMNDFRSTISDGLTGAYTIAKSKFHDMVQAGKLAANDMYGVGQSMADGIASGLNNRSGFLMSTIRGIVNQMVVEARDAAEVNSPSKKMARMVGAPMAEGVEYGWEQEAPRLFAMMRDTVESETARMGAAVQARAGYDTAQRYGGGEQPTSPAQISVNVYTENSMENSTDIRRLSWELGQETAREFRRRGLASL